MAGLAEGTEPDTWELLFVCSNPETYMPRQRRLMGPRKKVDIATLRDLPREERLSLLMRSVVECGGTSEADDSKRYRELLGYVRSVNRR